MGNCADISEYFSTNEIRLTILRGNFSKHFFRFLLMSLRLDDVNTRVQRISNVKLAPMREFLTKFISQPRRVHDNQ